MRSLRPHSPNTKSLPVDTQQLLVSSVSWPSRISLSRALTWGRLLSVFFPLCYGIFGVLAGKDTSWDLLNYHWYNPYAFLADRLDFDLAVGHHATYFNPSLDIPLYLVGEHLPPPLTGFLLACSQGLNFPLLFWLAWTLFSDLTPGRRFALSAVTSIAGMSGAGVLNELAGCAHDNITSIGVLASILVIVLHLQTLIIGRCWAAAGWVGLAGILAGVTAGLKLTTATYALGLGAALLFVPASLPRLILLAFSFGAGGVLGLSLGAGFWMHRLWEFSGSPFFPYFNDLFHSPLLLNASYRDTTFIPQELVTRLLFPFYFSANSFLVAEWHFRDVRILMVFVTLPCCAIWALARKAGKTWPASHWIDPTPSRFLAMAAAISYAAWLWLFCIYRYLLPLEMLAPLLIAVALGWLPLSNRARTTTLVALLVLSQSLVQINFAGRKPWGDHYLEVTAPFISPEEQAMVLMTGYEPMSYVIPYFPPSVPFLRIDGYLAKSDETNGLTTLMQQRVKEHRGRRYVLFHPSEKESVPKALLAYGLDFDKLPCRQVSSTVAEPLELCPVYALPHL